MSDDVFCVWATYSLGTSSGMRVYCIDKDVRFSVYSDWHYCPYCGRTIERRKLPFGISPGNAKIFNTE